MEPLTIDTKTLEFNLLREISNNYHQLPVEFCLKEFLGWEDGKIKQFVRERKKTRKAILKEYAQASAMTSLGCGVSRTCSDND